MLVFSFERISQTVKHDRTLYKIFELYASFLLLIETQNAELSELRRQIVTERTERSLEFKSLDRARTVSVESIETISPFSDILPQWAEFLQICKRIPIFASINQLPVMCLNFG